MTRFLRKAADVETASRKATWGTTVRRMSETDLEKLLGPEGLLSRLSVGRDKIMEIVDRRGSMLASRLLSKRNPSTFKNRSGEGITQDAEAATTGGPLEVLQSRKDSLHARKESYGDHPNFSPRTSTGGGLRRMASNVSRLRIRALSAFQPAHSYGFIKITCEIDFTYAQCAGFGSALTKASQFRARTNHRKHLKSTLAAL